MSKVLYIKASPMGKLSYSTAVADAFVEAYKKSHPKDQVKTIDLFSAKLPEFDFVAASGKYKIMRGKPHSPEEKQAWDKVVATIAEFKDADKYVLAVPMWNFSIPYRLKAVYRRHCPAGPDLYRRFSRQLQRIGYRQARLRRFCPRRRLSGRNAGGSI